MILKQILASLFRLFFKIKAFERHFFGVHKRIIQPLNLFKGVTKTISFENELILELQIQDWIPQQLYFLGKYEERELKFVSKALRPGDVFIDIGANIGLFSLVASRLVEDTGRIYAFEPFSSNYNKLTAHIARNGITNIIAEQLAISSGEFSITLGGTGIGMNSGMISEFSITAETAETVDATSLDKYRSLHLNRPVRMVKMDIEGGEYNALKGMERTLSHDRPILLMELDDKLLFNAGTSSKTIEEWLNGFGYLKRFLDKDGNICSLKHPDNDTFNFVFIPGSSA
ncbi:MAG: FkbM family methyltransferase [Chitinophagaceae bacterium]|nr:MAG: FkbM family methyltransferase [Chitinophagaceae bacterium]